MHRQGSCLEGRHTWINCVAHFTFSAPWHLEKCSLGSFFFPQRSSLEWQIASCHKVENINMAQQKLRSGGSDMQREKWIRPHLIQHDSDLPWLYLLVWRFCELINGLKAGKFCVPSFSGGIAPSFWIWWSCGYYCFMTQSHKSTLFCSFGSEIYV